MFPLTALCRIAIVIVIKNNNTFIVRRRFPIQVLSSFCIHFPHLSSVCVIHGHPCTSGVLCVRVFMLDRCFRVAFSHLVSIQTCLWCDSLAFSVLVCVCLCGVECMYCDVCVRQVFRGRSLNPWLFLYGASETLSGAVNTCKMLPLSAN